VKVSKNELKASLHKAFEGLGFHSGDYHNAADMVIWLETHGFYGFDRLLAALSYLNTTAPVHADLSQDDGSNFVLMAKELRFYCAAVRQLISSERRAKQIPVRDWN